MNDANENQIVETLRRARFRGPPGKVERQLLADATAALNSPSPARRMTSFTWRRAAIVLIFLISAAGLVAFFAIPRLSFADVQDAVAKQAWIHITYDNGSESWLDLSDGKSFYKDFEGRVVFVDADAVRFWYDAGTSVIVRDRGLKTPFSRQSAWEFAVEPNERASTRPGDAKTSRHRVERHDDTLNGEHVIRFDSYTTNAAGQGVLDAQLWADPATHLPVQEKRMLGVRDRGVQHRDAIVGEYSFPATGPANLQALGVPANLKVIDEDQPATSTIAQVQKEAGAARDRFPKTFRVVIWNPARNAEVDVRYYDGDRRAFSRWFQLFGDKWPGRDATVDQVLAWTSDGRRPIEQTVSDGKRTAYRHNKLPEIQDSMPRDRVHVLQTSRYADGRMAEIDSNQPPEAQWSYVGGLQTSIQLDTPADAPLGTLVFCFNRGDSRRTFWVDPAHDYLCIYAFSEKKLNGQWTKIFGDRLENLVQLPGGQWFAARHIHEDFGVDDDLHAEPRRTPVELDCKVLDRAAIPAGLFEVEPLLKDADVVAD